MRRDCWCTREESIITEFGIIKTREQGGETEPRYNTKCPGCTSPRSPSTLSLFQKLNIPPPQKKTCRCKRYIKKDRTEM